MALQRTDDSGRIVANIPLRDYGRGARCPPRIAAKWYVTTWNFVGDRRSKTKSGLLPDIPRGAHGNDAFIAAGEKHQFQKAAALIVEEVFVPSVLHQFRDDDHNASPRILFREIENKLNYGNDDEAIG
jgi:hypothetical protein